MSTTIKPPTVTPGVGQLSVSWLLPEGSYASIVKWRKSGASSVWNQVVSPSATQATLTGLDPVAYDVQIVLLPVGGVLTAKGTPLPAPLPPSPALRVGLINCSQKGEAVANVCKQAGIVDDRIDIGDGSNVSRLDTCLALGMRPLPLYNTGNGVSGGLNNRTSSEVGADIAALAPKLQARGIRWVEVGNEMWLNNRDPNSSDPNTGPVVETAMTYAAKFARAVASLAGTGIKAIAMVTGSYDVTGHGNWSDDSTAGWLRDFYHALPAGVRPDAISCHPYPVNGDPTVRSHEDNGWPAVARWHDIALGLGLDVDWLITEVGVRPDQVVGLQGQATQLSRMLCSLTVADAGIPGTPYPWVKAVYVYTAVPDTGGADFAVLNADATPRPAFAAVKALVSA